MNFAVFADLVEAKTKLASILPFFIGVLLSATYFNSFNFLNTIIFFVAMLIFDMTTTAINNLMDYQKNEDKEFERKNNIIGKANIDPKLVVKLIFIMLFVSSVLGIILVLRTGWPLLIMGVLCFIIGIFYTFGPLPLSRLPLGEVFSGITMGFGIPLIAVYVNTAKHAINSNTIIGLIFITVVPVATIANIMLANNLSDYEVDTRNGRHTLPIVIGKKVSIIIYQILAYIGYVSIVIAVLVGQLNWTTLIILLTLPIVMKNVQTFVNKQDKRLTFVTAIKNLVLENGSLILGLLMWLLFF